MILLDLIILHTVEPKVPCSITIKPVKEDGSYAQIVLARVVSVELVEIRTLRHQCSQILDKTLGISNDTAGLDSRHIEPISEAGDYQAPAYCNASASLACCSYHEL